MKQKYILKTDLLQLKKQLRKLKEQDKKFNNLYNRVTNIANRAEGQNDLKILQSTYADFNALMSTDNAPGLGAFFVEKNAAMCLKALHFQYFIGNNGTMLVFDL